MDTAWAFLAAHPEANLVGVVAVMLGATWPLYKTRTGILWAQAAVHLAFTLHFYLLGAETGSLMNFLALGQAVAAIPLGRQPGFRIVYLATLPVIATGAALTWAGPPSIAAAVGLALISLARYQTQTMALRVLMVAAICAWYVHDFLVLSIPGLTTDTLSLATSVVMIRRERRFKLAAVKVP